MLHLAVPDLFCDLTQRKLAVITDVSGRTVAPFFKGQSVQELDKDWTAGPSKDFADSLLQNISNKLPTYTTDSTDLMHTAEESSK